jgi:hypothetical protein
VGQDTADTPLAIFATFLFENALQLFPLSALKVKQAWFKEKQST